MFFQVSAYSWWDFVRSVRDTGTYGCALNNPGKTCLNCNSLVLCKKDGTIDMQVECSVLNPQTPYCDLKTKTCLARNTCAEDLTLPTMDCRYPGKFPDPMNCNNYLMCTSGDDTEAVRVPCPDNTRYDHGKRTCSSDSPCASYSAEKGGLCFGKPFQILGFNNDQSIYVVCPVDPTETVKLRSCESKLMKIDLKTLGDCNFNCPNEGFYPNPDLNKYNVCVKVAGGFKSYEKDCPDNSIFNPELGTCLHNDPRFGDYVWDEFFPKSINTK